MAELHPRPMSDHVVVRVTLRAHSVTGQPARFSTTIILSRDAYQRGDHCAESVRRACIVGHCEPFVHESERIVRGSLDSAAPRRPSTRQALRRRGLH